MSLFDFLLSLLLVLNPSIVGTDTFDKVYSRLDDVDIRSVIVEDSAIDLLSQLTEGGIMTLDFGTTDSSNLKNIADRLYTGGNSAAQWLQTIYQSIGSANSTTRSSVLGYLYQLDSSATKISSFLTSTSQDAYSPGLVGLLQKLTMMFGSDSINGYPRQTMLAAQSILSRLNGISSSGGWDSRFTSNLFQFDDFSWQESEFTPFDALVSILNTLSSTFSLPAGSMVMGSNGVPYEAGNSRTIASWLHDDLMGTASLIRVSSDWSGLQYDGASDVWGYDAPISAVLNSGFLGLASLMSGSDRVTTFTLLNEDITEGTEDVEVGNLLDALGLMGSQLQNPLQRLAYVFASPLDLEIKENVTENQEAANDNFLKPGSNGSVSKDDIGSAADFGSGAKDFIDAGGSAGDAFAQLGQGSTNWGFFSQAAMDDMLGSPPPSALSDDDMGELGDDGLYHLLPQHLFAVDSKIGKGDKS